MEKEELTENDRRLIEKARRSRSSDYVHELREQADTEAARKELRECEIRAWHYEEWEAGLL